MICILNALTIAHKLVLMQWMFVVESRTDKSFSLPNLANDHSFLISLDSLIEYFHRKRNLMEWSLKYGLS